MWQSRPVPLIPSYVPNVGDPGKLYLNSPKSAPGACEGFCPGPLSRWEGVWSVIPKLAGSPTGGSSGYWGAYEIKLVQAEA
jgi:hypothetical protein